MSPDKKLKDGLRFENKVEGVVFNHYSFCELIKHIMVKYGNITYEIATEKLANSFLVNAPESFEEVSFLRHELVFHWAMLTMHGDMYWTKGIPSDFNDFKEEYLSWEAEIKLTHKLNAPYEDYEITSG